MDTPRNSLHSDRRFDTVTYFAGQRLEYEAPGLTPWAAGEFAAINYLRSFSQLDILSIRESIVVHVRSKTPEMVEKGKKRSEVFPHTVVNVHVQAPDPKKSAGPMWTVSALG